MSIQTRSETNATSFAEPTRGRPRWWREILYIGVFYGLYTLVRNVHGKSLSVTTANHHAEDIVHLERMLHVFHEEQIQQFFLGQTWFIRMLDAWYGSAHFIMTIGVLLWLFHLQTDRYRQWRNILFATTGLALVGYMAYPLTPPRLLDPSFGFNDTLASIGGLWNFDSGTVKNLSNQYAAMPSLHVGWALWCASAIMPVLRHTWTRVLVAIYPATTITAIVVTANHYWADVFGGVVIFALGYLLSSFIESRSHRPGIDEDAKIPT